jgi:hypothetical protein
MMSVALIPFAVKEGLTVKVFEIIVRDVIKFSEHIQL